jgi:hypothetical protein
MAKRKAEVTLAARRGLKEAGSKDEYEAYGGGRADKGLLGPYPSSRLVVNPAAAREKESSLLREICEASGIHARGVIRFIPTTTKKSAEGKVGQAVG